MRVLHIFGEMGLGGAERRTVALLPFLDAQETPQHFATLSGVRGILDEPIRAHGGQVHPCRIGPGFPLRFARLLRQVRPDVVHSHIHWASGPVLAQARAMRVPGRILHFRASRNLHSAPTGRRRALRDRAFRALCDRNATGILSVSEGAFDACWPSWRSDPRCRVVYSGVRLDRFDIEPDRAGVRAELGIPPDARILIHVGNIHPAKNHARLARLFGALCALRDDVWLVVVGKTKDPGCERALREEADRAGVSERVVLTGAREDVPRLLLASDLFVFPSVTEGLPGSVVEARVAGLPVVASDLPGTLEIQPHVSGVTCLSLDLPDAVWLDAMLAGLDAGRDHGAVDRSPFTARASAAAHIEAWRAALGAR